MLEPVVPSNLDAKVRFKKFATKDWSQAAKNLERKFYKITKKKILRQDSEDLNQH